MASGAPENDAFALAEDLGLEAETAVPVLSYGSTRQVGEPEHDGNRWDGSLWWTWTAPSDGLLRLDLRDRGFTDLAVYTGDALDALEEIASEGSLPLEVVVAAGTTYRIALADEISDELRLRFLPEAANDDFADRADLGTAVGFAESFETLTASREDGEPLVAGDASLGNSVWWSWEAPEDGLLRLELEVDEAWAWRLGVFEGESLASLVEVTNLFAPNVLELRVPAGRRLELVVARDDAGASGEGVLKGSFEPMIYQPTRDAAVDLGSVVAATGSGSTLADDDHAIWWTWTAPDHGLLKWEAEEPDGSSPILRVEDATGVTITRRSADGGHAVRGGEPYFLRVWASDAVVDYQLDFIASLGNDDFSEPAPLVIGENGFDLTAAGTDEEEPSSFESRSLWWTWTAPADGLLWLIEETLHDGSRVRIWDESAMGDLLASMWNGRLELRVTEGTKYRIGVMEGSSLREDIGPGVLRAIFLPDGPEHDDLADAIDLGDGLRAYGEGTREGATAEPGETVLPFGDASVWWKWTAPEAVRVSLGLFSGTLGDDLRLWTGGGIGSLTELARGSEVAAGETVWISLGGWASNSIRKSFELRASPTVANDAFGSGIDLGLGESVDERFVLGDLTRETGEEHGELAGGSQWWRWTAPRDLNVRLAIEPQGAVYVGDTLAGLERVAAMTYDTVDFAARAGRIYHFAVLGERGNFGALRFSSSEPPPGDRYHAPIELGSAEEFTLSGPDEIGTLDGPGRELFPNAWATTWWRWTAPADGWLNPGFDWHVLREGADGAEIVEDGAVVAGESYLLVYAQRSGGASREWFFVATVSNDTFAGVIDLGSAAEVEVRSSVWGTEADAQELALLPEWASQSDTAGWWQWTAPFTGSLDFDGKSIGWLDGMVTVLRGTDPATMEVVHQPGTGISGDFGGEFGVIGGETYVFLVATRAPRLGDEVSLKLVARPGPPNDDPDTATDLGSATEIEVTGSNVGALGDRINTPWRSGPGVWWRWTAPEALRVRVSAEVVGANQRVRIFRELADGELEEVDHGPEVNRSEESAEVFASRAGETYLIFVEGKDFHYMVDEGMVQLVLSTGALVANDDFAAADVVTGAVPPVIGGWHEGTLEAGEPLADWPNDTVSSRWWSWTAERDAVVLARRSNAQLRVLADDGAGGWEEVSESDFTTSTWWEIVAGTEYRLAVIGTDDTPGFFELNFREVSRAANDDFVAALDLGTDANADWSGEIFLPTTEPGEPGPGRSVWFVRTAPEDGIFRVDTSESSLNWWVDIYEGGSLEGLSVVIGRAGGVAFEAVAGRTYRIAANVPGSGPGGELELVVGPDAAPVNDDFANRLRLEGEYAQFSGDTILADIEPGEASTGSTWRSLWWEWEAPVNGKIRLVKRRGATRAMIYESSDTPSVANPGRLLGSHSGSFEIEVTRGQKYIFQIVTDAAQPEGSSFQYEVDFSHSDSLPPGTDRPRNDFFEDRIDLGSGTGVSVVGDFYAASMESGRFRFARDGSLWWSWTAPHTGSFALRFHGTFFPDEVAVMTGEAAEDLTTIALERSPRSPVWFDAVAGEHYVIRLIDGSTRILSFISRFVEFELMAEPTSGAANDDFAAAVDMGAGFGSLISGSNAGASAEPGEPAHGGEAAKRSVWYVWTATETGMARLSASRGVMRAGIYQGDMLDALNEIATGTEPLDFPVVAGESYRIALDSSPPVDFLLSLSEAPEPVPMSPDNFANAQELVGAVVDFMANADGAGVEPGEPIHDRSSHNERGSVWFRWVAPGDGTVEVGPNGGSVRQIAVYRGSSLETLARVGGASFSRSVRFFAEAGGEYWIAVTGTTGVEAMRLEQFAVMAANDNLAAAEELVGTAVSVTGTTVGASRELGEVDWRRNAMSGTVWYRWQAPGDGVLRLILEGDETKGLGLLQVGASGALIQVADASVAFSTGRAVLGHWVEAGEDYRIGVGIDAHDEPGPFDLVLEMSPPMANDNAASAENLGAVTTANLRGFSLDADGEGSPRWWRWTAPVDGGFLLQGKGSIGSKRIEVHQLAHGVTTKIRSSLSGREPVTWMAVAGEEYLFSVEGTVLSEGGFFEVMLEPLSAPNDEPAGAIVLTDGLPSGDARMVNGATRTAGESFHGGSLWWEWRALEDGRVELDLGNSENRLEAVVYRVEGMVPGRLLDLSDRGRDRWSFEAEAGAIYRLGIGSQYSNRTVTGLVDLRLRPAVESANDAIADAAGLVGDEFQITTPTSGATIEDGERTIGPSASRHAHSLWWSWVPPRDGMATLEAGANDWAFLYQEGGAGELVEALGAHGLPGVYRVEGGRRYLLAAGDHDGGELSLKLTLSPEGDLFNQPVELGQVWTSVATGSWTGATREEFEPLHSSRAAERSIWFLWQAPVSGTLVLSLDSGGIQAGAAVYRGAEMSGLTKVLDSGVAEVVGGEAYRIAVDSRVASGGEEFTLRLSLEVPDDDLPGYAAWVAEHFTQAEADSGSDDDPDRDGRPNLIEMTMGTDPRTFDRGPAMAFEREGDHVRLSLRRLQGLEDWWHDFDVSGDLKNWHAVTETRTVHSVVGHADGSETLSVLLLDYRYSTHPQLFFRPTVKIGVDPFAAAEAAAYE